MRATIHIVVDEEVKKAIEDKKLIVDESNNSCLRRLLNLKTYLNKNDLGLSPKENSNKVERGLKKK